jgi:subtilisin family serine protease
MQGVAGTVFQDDILYRFGGGDPRVTIAVLDGPVDRTHDCFRGARLTPLETDSLACSGDGGRAMAHGTHIASVIFGQPCSSVEGLTPLCRGLILPIFADFGTQCCEQEIARAMMLALANGAHIIHLSAGRIYPGASPPALQDVIAECARRNVLIVTGAGSEGCEGLAPNDAANASVLAVGGIDSGGRKLTQGGEGSYLFQDVLTPGTHVTGAALQGGIARRSGTNFAAALVTGIAGLLLSVRLKQGLPLDPRAAADAIRHGAILHRQERRLTGRDQVQSAIEWMSRRDPVVPPAVPAKSAAMRSIPAK